MAVKEGKNIMNKNIALVTAGIFFSLIALAHLIRLLTGFEVTLRGNPVPLWTNAIALIVTGALAVWMFAAAKQK
jgi:hypothetical protein